MENVNLQSLDPRKQELLEARFYGSRVCIHFHVFPNHCLIEFCLLLQKNSQHNLEIHSSFFFFFKEDKKARFFLLVDLRKFFFRLRVLGMKKNK